MEMNARWTYRKMVENGNNMTGGEPFVRDDVRAFLTMLAGMNRPDMREVPLAETRAGMIAMTQMADLPPRELAVIRDFACPSPGGDIPLRLYDARAERGPGRLIVYLHGGGYVAGGIATAHSLCTEIAATMDLPVVSVEYRLAPEHPFPAAPEDAEAAARWLAGSPAELARQVTGLIPMGDSAGGNLAIVVSQSLLLEPAAVPVVMQVPIYPPTDDIRSHPSFAQLCEGYLLTLASIDFFDEAYRADPSDRRARPIHGPIAGMPPTVLATASLDPLRDSGRAFAAALIEAGVDTTYLELAGTIHGFVQLRKAIAGGARDVRAILDAAKSMLERIA
jgi:acetyl esterase